MKGLEQVEMNMSRHFSRYIRLLEYRGFCEGFMRGGISHNILWWDRWAMPPLSDKSTDQIGRDIVRNSFSVAVKQMRRHG